PELANPYLEFQFDHLFSNLLPETWETFHRCRDAIAALRPDTLLIASPTRFEYAAIAAARATHVPTIFVNHGILGKIHKFGVPTDRFWAWGESSLRSARSALHWQEHQVAVVGAPQIHGAIEQVVAARREPRCARLARLDLADAGRVLLVITGGNTEGPFSLVTGDAIWNSWQAVLAWIRAHPEITVILKPHPAADLHPWYETIRAILPNLFVRRFNALEDALAVADGAVLMEHVTTAALVAVGASCPLLYVNTARRLENVYTARWTDELETVRRAAEIPLALTRLLEDADFRAMLLDRGHDFFAKNILPSERIPGALRKALSRIHAAESGGPLTASSTVV
ncbi:MAG TPA: hypothetical protein VNB06_13060, partial [Thermoanaerobaculia bacterium]|nr:hypothetical protein [Thermoanaerobaculia bacterium]